MKPTEYPEEDSRAVAAVPAEAPAQKHSAAPVAASSAPVAERPRYVEVPPSPEQIRAQRNIAWGVVCVTLAVIGLWLGLKFDRAMAGVSLASSLGTFGIFWLLYNSQLLRQKHGFFLGFGLVAVLGAGLPFAALGLRALDRMADESISGKTADGRTSAPPPVPTAATAPPAPSAPELSPDDSAAAPAESEPASTAKPAERALARNGSNMAASRTATPDKKGATAKAAPVDDGQVRDFEAPPVDLKSGKIIRFQEDCVVSINGQKKRLKAGQMFPYSKVEDDMVTFLAGDQEVKIDSLYVSFVGKSQEKEGDIKRMAAMEAANRYPALADEGSPEHSLFIKRADEMSNDPALNEYFKNPRWPLMLAEELASAHGWKAVDNADDDKPASANTPAPTDVKPAAESPAPAAPTAPAPASAPQPTTTPGKPALPPMLPEDKTRNAGAAKAPAPTDPPQTAPPPAAVRPAIVPNATVPPVIPPPPR